MVRMIASYASPNERRYSSSSRSSASLGAPCFKRSPRRSIWFLLSVAMGRSRQEIPPLKLSCRADFFDLPPCLFGEAPVAHLVERDGVFGFEFQERLIDQG